MKRLLLLICFVSALSVRSQTDSIRYSRLDSLTPEQLLDYYINEPEPPQFYKGPDTGDSLYYVLRPLAAPNQTVEADPLTLNREKPEDAINNEELDTTNTADQKFRPKLSLGGGSLTFDGDLNKRHFQPPAVGRGAANIGISQRLTRYLQLDFMAMFGKLGANENKSTRHENFQSEIRVGGINLTYDFGNFIPDKYTVRPFVSLGVVGFEYLSKTDLKDKNGNLYYYWSDGSIKDRAENAPDAQHAKSLVRDYKYESDIRELNRDGFGKYPERAWAFPLGVGFVMKVTNRIDARFGFQYYLTTTDYIDGVTAKSLNGRAGNKRNDHFGYTSVSLQYDLIGKPLPKKKPADTLSNSFWLALNAEDNDHDGVPDIRDKCLGTPDGAKVDLNGCPLDEDNDGIPNYRDDELNTPPGAPVNDRGVAQSDDYWKEWYAKYMNDSTDLTASSEVVNNIFAPQPVKKKKKKKNDDVFTVELARYPGAIPSDELAFLLSIGDINTMTLADGTTVVYTTGSYDKLETAVKRRDEFRNEGNKNAGISRIKGNNIVPVSDEELKELLKGEIEDLMNINLNGADSSNNASNEPKTESFGRNDIVYRVQLGAFRNRISTSVFNTSAGSVLELKTGENIYRYVTKGYKTIEEAAAVRADLVIQGYGDAFVSAYKEGKRIPLSETKATVDKEFKEDLNENKMFSSIDKNLVAFKVQLGSLKKKAFEANMDEKVKDLPDVEKQTTLTGSIRYTSGGSFKDFESAEKFRKTLESEGFLDALVIATFKNEIISVQEAKELLK